LLFDLCGKNNCLVRVRHIEHINTKQKEKVFKTMENSKYDFFWNLFNFMEKYYFLS